MIINGIHMNDRNKPVDQFDLEEAIMNAWRTLDDIKALYKSVEYMNEDQVMNALIGLEIFADMRFNELWNTFEQCTANEVFDDDKRFRVLNREDVAKAFESFGQEQI